MEGKDGKAKPEIEKPSLCENCEKREPVRLMTSPTFVGKAGLPVAVWLCEACAVMVPKPASKKKRPTRGRMSAGKYGSAVMAIAFRFGGFSARQLGELLLRENPGRFAKGEREGSTKRRAVKAAADALILLRRNGLMRSVGVWREHVYGERGGRIEEWYYLHGEGVLWGARTNGVVDGKEATVAYARHQLPRQAEHAAYRNDLYLRWLWDFEAKRRREVEAGTLEENAKHVVVSGVADFSGESWEGYPYPVGYLKTKKGKEVPKRGRTHEWLYPDGHPILKWADGLECAFEIEAERESWAAQAATKVDRFAAYWLRLYRQMEEEWREPKRRPIEEEIARVEARRKQLYEEGHKKGEIRSKTLSEGRLRELRAKLAEINASRPAFQGLPPEVLPVVFMHQSAVISEGVRTRLRDRQYAMPRLDEFRQYLTEAMRGWATVQLSEIDEKQKAAGRPTVEILPEHYVHYILDFLFVFTSWEQLRVGDEDDDEVGASLYPVYTPLGAMGRARSKTTTLRRTAEVRGSLDPSKFTE